MEDLGVLLDQLEHLVLEERMETLVQGGQEDFQDLLEKRVDEVLLAARVNQGTQDLKVLLDPRDPVGSLVRMDEMGLVYLVLKEEMVMKVSLVSLVQRVRQVTLVQKEDLDLEETMARGVLQEDVVVLVKREILDTQGPMALKDPEELVLCNVIWSRKLGITVLAAMVLRNVPYTPLSWPLPWIHQMVYHALLSTTCETPFSAWSVTSLLLRATVPEVPVLL